MEAEKENGRGRKNKDGSGKRKYGLHAEWLCSEVIERKCDNKNAKPMKTNSETERCQMMMVAA